MEPFVSDNRLTPSMEGYEPVYYSGECDSCDEMHLLNEDDLCKRCVGAIRAAREAFLRVIRTTGSREDAQAAYLAAWKALTDAEDTKEQLVNKTIASFRTYEKNGVPLNRGVL